MEALVIEGDPTEGSQLSYLIGGQLSIFKTGFPHAKALGPKEKKRCKEVSLSLFAP
jgi:hypothetical protein